ncbi:MAG: hypothetical protein J6Y89_09375, partial [Lachnospiraceae bacterium]|nr:hypothetical protein [Lachnospiraceae bacterium]
GNPLLDLLTAIIGLIFSSLIYTLIQLASSGPCCSKVSDLKVLGFRFSRPQGGKLEYRGYKPGLSISADMIVDFKKHPDIDNKKLIALDKAQVLLCGILTVVIGIVIFVLCLMWSFRIDYHLPASVVFLSGFWILLFAAGKCCLAVYSVFLVSSDKTLGGYYAAAVGMLRSGITFEKMDLKPVRELSFAKVTDAEKKMYFPVYFCYLDAKGLYDMMFEAVADIENIIKPGESSKAVFVDKMMLIYYYSYHNPVPSKAKEYYHSLGTDIEKDNDSNSLRIKGFYELNCFGNVEKAREYAGQAMAKLDSFSVPAEREYERTCIAKLNSAIEDFLK